MFTVDMNNSRFTVVHIECNTIINNNARMSCVLHTHNSNPTFAPPCTYICTSQLLGFSLIRRLALATLTLKSKGYFFLIIVWKNNTGTTANKVTKLSYRQHFSKKLVLLLNSSSNNIQSFSIP